MEIDGFTPRSKELLYVFPQPNTLFLLDVLEHGDWFGDLQLVEIIHRNWPAVVAPFKMTTRIERGPAPPPSAADIVKARNYGLQPVTPLIDGTVYLPFGGGLSTCGLNQRIVRQADDLRARARDLQHVCQEGAEQIQAGIEAQAGQRLDQLHLKVTWFGGVDLLVVETQSNIGILMPGQKPPGAG